MTAQPENVDRNEILALMGDTVKRGDWLFGRCPSHADGQKRGKDGWSLGLSNNGVLRCFAGCAFKDVMRELRGDSRPAPPTPLRQPEREELITVYAFKDADGTVVAEKGRFETPTRKSFRWRVPGVEGWPTDSGLKMAELPLYGLTMLRERPTEPVYVVEGEKACEACWEHGLVAVTHGGGASLKDFGDTLTPLRGRTVYLWPDNDVPGAAYMTLLRAKLEALGCNIHLVSTPFSLPPKGDAFDYFDMGGTVEALGSMKPGEPVVSIPGSDAVNIEMATEMGRLAFRFSEMEKGSRSLDCAISIEVEGLDPYHERLNLDSSSARTQLRRDLEAVYGKDGWNWPTLMNKAVHLARDSFLQQDRGADVFDMPEPMGEVLLIPPLVVADGPTIFFGDGSSGKSYLIDSLILHCAYGIPWCGFEVPRMKWMVVDYEGSASNFRYRMGRLAEGMGDGVLPMDVIYWEARGIPLRDQWEAIKRSCEKHGVTGVVIDSAAPACGGPPEESPSVLAFFHALKRIGLPAIIIAHITKAGETEKPYGSNFWHNEARRTWFVKRIQEEDSDEIDIGLYCKKVNDGRKPLPIGMHLTFDETRGPVTVQPQQINLVPELQAATNLRSQIWDALTEPKTAPELAEELGAITKTVLRHLKHSSFVAVGMKDQSNGGRPATSWGRRTEREEDA